MGLVFLKYISDAFDERYNQVKEEYFGMEEDRDAYEAEKVLLQINLKGKYFEQVDIKVSLTEVSYTTENS